MALFMKRSDHWWRRTKAPKALLWIKRARTMTSYLGLSLVCKEGFNHQTPRNCLRASRDNMSTEQWTSSNLWVSTFDSMIVNKCVHIRLLSYQMMILYGLLWYDIAHLIDVVCLEYSSCFHKHPEYSLVTSKLLHQIGANMSNALVVKRISLPLCAKVRRSHSRGWGSTLRCLIGNCEWHERYGSLSPYRLENGSNRNNVTLLAFYAWSNYMVTAPSSKRPYSSRAWTPR